jgi:tRNA threonylcarbamoyladenosine biosynthesis protein TsaB
MLLGLDTATESVRLALVDGERAWTRTLPAERGRSHSVVMLPALDELVKESGFRRSDVAGIVCCVGPGGFTGLRTGVATAEGLAQTGVPTWGFSSFALWAEALALSGQAAAWILLDGQRGEAFLQRWGGGAPRETRRELITALTTTLATLPWFAPGAFAERLGALPGRLDLGGEAAAAEAALISLVRKRSQGIPESPLVPFYLRETDAEAKFPEASTHLPESHRLGRPR